MYIFKTLSMLISCEVIWDFEVYFNLYIYIYQFNIVSYSKIFEKEKYLTLLIINLPRRKKKKFNSIASNN
jgi:hypothetical protein